MDAPPRSVSTDPWAAATEWPWYVTRLAKGAPEVPCELWIADGERGPNGELLSDQRLIATVNGVEIDISNRWPPGWPWRAVRCHEKPRAVADAVTARDIRRAPLPF